MDPYLVIVCAKFHVQKHSQAVKLLTAHCNSTSGAQSFTGMSYVQYFYQSTNCLYDVYDQKGCDWWYCIYSRFPSQAHNYRILAFGCCIPIF